MITKFNKYYKSMTVYEKILFIGLLLQILLIFAGNFTQIEKWVDYDSGMAIKHNVEMWRNGSLIVPNHNYPTSMENDCAAFFAAPIYMATGNLSLSFGIVQLFIILIFLYVLMKVLKYHDISRESRLLATLLIFTPYQMGQLAYTNMLFFSVGQYEIRVLAMLSIMALILHKGDKIQKDFVFIFIIGLISTIMTSISLGFSYLLVSVFVPAIIAIVCEIINNKSFKTIPKKNIIAVLILLCATMVSGLYISINHVPVSLHSHKIIPDYNFAENFLDIFIGIFILFGGLYLNEYDLLSCEGISLVIHFGFTICFAIFLVLFFKKMKEHTKDGRIFYLFTAFITGTNLLIFMLTEVKTAVFVFPARYHLLWIIPALIAVAISVSHFINCMIKNSWWKNVVRALVIAMLILLNGIGFYIMYFFDDNDNVNVEAFSREYADEMNVERIYVSDPDMGRIILGVDLDHTIIPIRCEDGEVLLETWGIAPNPIEPKGSLWLIKNEEWNNYPKEYRDNYEYVDCYNEWQLYYGK